MLCPLCERQGGEKLSEETPFEQWKCRHCQEEYPVFAGYPVHPAAFSALAQGNVRCPICGGLETGLIPDAPDMGIAKVFSCRSCQGVFPALAYPQKDAANFIPVHPQAMVETVTGVEHVPNFAALLQRLGEYISQTGFTLARSEDKLDLDSQVREYSLFFVPTDWLKSHPQRLQAIQGRLTFFWHAGLAQHAGAPAEKVTGPLPLNLRLGVAVNPAVIGQSISSYLRLVQGLGEVLAENGLTQGTSVDAEVSMEPVTQKASVRELGAVRQVTLDITSPSDWLALIRELTILRPLIEQAWGLVKAQES